MKSIDNEVLAGYNAGIEKNRLRKGLGLIEFERTKEIISQYLPESGVIYDIGGGYGEYSFWLSSLGYVAHLYDISEKNIEMANVIAEENGYSIKSAAVADAREINRPDESADAILLLGPLYHIIDPDERRLALEECMRLLKPGGLLFAAAITRYATLLWAVTCYGMNNRLLDETEFRDMLEHEIKTGHHVRNPNSKYKGIGRSYFHSPKELKSEISAVGFVDVDVRGVIGPAWLAPNLDDIWDDKVMRESLMRVVRMCDKESDLMGLSTHLLSISRKRCSTNGK